MLTRRKKSSRPPVGAKARIGSVLEVEYRKGSEAKGFKAGIVKSYQRYWGIFISSPSRSADWWATIPNGFL